MSPRNHVKGLSYVNCQDLLADIQSSQSAVYQIIADKKFVDILGFGANSINFNAAYYPIITILNCVVILIDNLKRD